MRINFITMKHIISQYICLLINLLFVVYYFKNENSLNLNKQIDYEVELFKDECYLNMVTLIQQNSTENFLFKGSITNFSRNYIINLIDQSNLTRIKYS